MAEAQGMIELQAFLQSLPIALSVFFLVDPLATIPIFLAMTAGHDRTYRKRMALRAALTCFFVLCAFALAGGLLFRLYGISLPAFQVAGGIILLLIGLDMAQARRSGTKEVPGEAAESAAKADVGIVPLGIPMLAGPGSISNVMVLVGQSKSSGHTAAVFVAVAVTTVVSYMALAGAERVRRLMTETSIHILTRIMGMILTAIAVQFIANGLHGLGILETRN
jgi:multiple antibiotic resistance protein